MEKVYDIIIIGGGVAGMTAGLYARRAGADVLILEKNAVGGQAGLTYEIGNYPAFETISGFELVTKMQQQITALGVEIKYAQVTGIDNGEIKAVKTRNETYFCKAIILCLGARAVKLGVANEERLAGRGVSYCAVCDGAFYRGKVVAVVGRGNTAVEDALYLANIAKKVYLISRRDSLKAQDILMRRLESADNKGKIEVIYNTEVKEILGDNKVGALQLYDKEERSERELSVDGVFVAVGHIADTEWVSDLVATDENGYIVVDKCKKTNIDGIYSAGDCTNTVLRQVITATADGAIAGNFAYEYIKNLT